MIVDTIRYIRFNLPQDEEKLNQYMINKPDNSELVVETPFLVWFKEHKSEDDEWLPENY